MRSLVGADGDLHSVTSVGLSYRLYAIIVKRPSQEVFFMNQFTVYATRAKAQGILLLLALPALLMSGCSNGPPPTPLPTTPSPTLVRPAGTTFSLTSTA